MVGFGVLLPQTRAGSGSELCAVDAIFATEKVRRAIFAQKSVSRADDIDVAEKAFVKK